MEPVLVFTDNSKPMAFHFLAAQQIGVGYVPLRPEKTVIDDAVLLAIIDCGLDTEAGLSLLRTLKTEHPEVPVIFITTVRSENLVLQAFKLGAREYFRKPLATEELAAAVAMIIGFKRQLPEATPSPSPAALSLVSPPVNLPERLQRAIDCIEENLSAHHSLDELARQACMSKYHFCRLFKRHVGLSPKQYCTGRRMEQASRLLGNPDQSVTRTAFHLGFNDITEFTRQFKKFTGLTPRDFRSGRSR